MHPQNSTSRRSPSGLALGVTLGILFLALCLWYVWQDLQAGLATSKITASLIHGGRIGSVLPLQLIAFAVAAIIVHVTLGAAAVVCAHLTESAFPDQLTGRGRALVVIWMILLSGLVLVANATFFPSSKFSMGGPVILVEWRGWRAVHLAMYLAAFALVFLCIRSLLQNHRPVWNQTLTLVAAAPLLLITAAFVPVAPTRSLPSTQSFEAPHLVILGIDSLRDDRAGEGRDGSTTPNLNQFLGGAYRFTDTITPLARTYGAWVSILTGRHPVSTNARFNLMPRTLVREGDTLGDALQEHGYATIYATDEVRFANFDESFGFGQVITPPVGAVDFILGRFGDLPLINLITQTRIGGWLFPSNRGNRAAYVTYEPAQFTERLRSEIDISRPTFLAIHLTLSHWPYSWAGLEKPETPPENRDAYERAITEADRQFADVMEILGDKGVLDNAIVVVLSDHGEALGWHSDSMLRGVATGQEVWNSLWGHGTSVMSPHQYGVVLAMRPFGRARLPGAAGEYGWPVSLEDVRPTLQDIATGSDSRLVDGVSLLPYLDGLGDTSVLEGRIRFTETGFNTKLVMAGKYNESGLINEGAAFYELAAGSGWVQLREDRLHELMVQKQRAAIGNDFMLAAIPSADGGSTQYWLTHRRSPVPRQISARPSMQTDPDGARLWDALHGRFPGELPGRQQAPPP